MPIYGGINQRLIGLLALVCVFLLVGCVNEPEPIDEIPQVEPPVIAEESDTDDT